VQLIRRNFIGVLETGGTADRKECLGVNLSRNIKRKGTIVYTPSFVSVFDPVFMKLALTILTVTEIRHGV